MTKVLRGSSRQAFAFMRENWQDLAKLSAVPALVLFASIWLQALLLAGLSRRFAERVGDGIEGGKISQLLSFNTITNIFVGLVAFLVFGWLFAMIVRFTWTGEAVWLTRDRQAIKAIRLTVLYSFGVVLLLLLVMLASNILVVAVLGLLFDYKQSQILQGYSVWISLLFALSPSVLQYWLLLRFLVGLPAVSFGNAPRFFRDLWPLAKGESWGVPLRLTVPGLVAILLMVALMYPALIPLMIAMMGQSPDQQGDSAFFNLLAEALGWRIFFAALLIFVLVPFFWFFTLLLTTAYHRFSQRQQHR